MGRIFKECDYGERADDVLQMVYDFYFKGVHPKDHEKNMHQIVKVGGIEPTGPSASVSVHWRLFYQLWYIPSG